MSLANVSRHWARHTTPVVGERSEPNHVEAEGGKKEYDGCVLGQKRQTTCRTNARRVNSESPSWDISSTPKTVCIVCSLWYAEYILRCTALEKAEGLRSGQPSGRIRRDAELSFSSPSAPPRDRACQGMSTMAAGGWRQSQAKAEERGRGRRGRLRHSCRIPILGVDVRMFECSSSANEMCRAAQRCDNESGHCLDSKRRMTSGDVLQVGKAVVSRQAFLPAPHSSLPSSPHRQHNFVGGGGVEWSRAFASASPCGSFALLRAQSRSFQLGKPRRRSGFRCHFAQQATFRARVDFPLSLLFRVASAHSSVGQRSSKGSVLRAQWMGYENG